MRQEKIAALRHAIRWLEQNAVEVLAPRPTWLAGVKRLAEAAMMANLFLEEDIGRLDPVFQDNATAWLDACWRVLRKGDFFVDCVERDRSWVVLAMTYVPFFHHGRRSPRFEDLLRERSDDVEPDWFVRLAVACAYEHLGVRSTLDLDALAREAWLLRTTEYQRIDPARAYETTHVVFWLTALGRLPPHATEAVREWGPRWIDHYREVQNADILAELLMMMHYVNAPCASEQTWKWLLSTQDPDGSFPAPELPSSRALSRYHATVVGAMALAICAGENHCVSE